MLLLPRLFPTISFHKLVTGEISQVNAESLREHQEAKAAKVSRSCFFAACNEYAGEQLDPLGLDEGVQKNEIK